MATRLGRRGAAPCSQKRSTWRRVGRPRRSTARCHAANRRARPARSASAHSVSRGPASRRSAPCGRSRRGARRLGSARRSLLPRTTAFPLLDQTRRAGLLGERWQMPDDSSREIQAPYGDVFPLATRRRSVSCVRVTTKLVAGNPSGVPHSLGLPDASAVEQVSLPLVVNPSLAESSSWCSTTATLPRQLQRCHDNCNVAERPGQLCRSLSIHASASLEVRRAVATRPRRSASRPVARLRTSTPGGPPAACCSCLRHGLASARA